jgi:catechol 2,3-dioxygenase-like lactoylglutathione lyase family enzyme
MSCWRADSEHHADPTTASRPRSMGDALQAKIFFITLAVDDLDRSIAFYRDGLGWPTEGIVGQQFHDEVTGADGTIAFFNLDGGLLLGLYERINLAQGRRPAARPAQFCRVQPGRPR